MSKSFAIGTSVSLLVFIATLAASTYGLGVEKDQKDGPGYQASSIFTMIGASGTVIALILLIIAVLRLCSVSDAVASSMSYQPIA